MRRIFELLIFLSIPLGAYAGPDETPKDVCQAIERKTSTGELYTQIETLPGRQVFLLFSPHLDPQLQKDLQDLLTQKTPAPDRVKKLALEILKSQKDILNQKKKELRTLDELTHQNKISWLGVEQAEVDLSGFRTHLLLQRLTLEKQLATAGLRSSEIADVVLLLYDSVQYWISQMPDRLKLYQWVGIEDAFQHQEALKSAEKIERLKSVLQEYERLVDKVEPQNVKDLENEIAQILGEKRRVPAGSESQLIQRFPSSETRGLAEEQLRAARELIEISDRRDAAVAEHLTGRALPGSGIVTMGRAHAEGLTSRLREACLSRRKRVPPSP